jgi:hypothetical protein
MILRIGPSLVLVLAAACAGGGPRFPDIDAALPDEPDARRNPDARAADARTADAPGTKDAPAAADARLPDGAPDAMVTGITLEPASVTIARTGTASLTVTLDEAAPAGGAAVTLESDSSGVTVPTSVTVPAGERSVSFIATGVTVGPATEVRARRGAGVAAAEVRVVPRLVSVTPAGANLLLGEEATYTVNLEDDVSGGAVSVALAVDNPAVAAVPISVNVASGSRSAAFAVDGDAPGVTSVQAAIGNARVEAQARVFALLFSEILYDLGGDDDQREWIELYNAASVPVDATGLRIQVASTGGLFVDSLELAGTIPAGGCVVVGGPMLDGGDAGPSFGYFLAADFATDLGNAGSGGGDAGDGIQLRAASGVLDNVIYGRNNDDHVLDEDGVPPAEPDTGDASPDHSIERTSASVDGAWVTERSPSPGDCSPIAK